MAKEKTNILWYCDRCGTLLNEQRGFKRHKDKSIWKCKKCGYKNYIDKDNIMDPYLTPGDGVVFGCICFARTVLLYLIIISVIAIIFSQQRNRFLSQSLILFIVGYILMAIITMLFERYVLKYHDNRKLWVLWSFGYYISHDIVRPINEIINAFSALFTVFSHKSLHYLIYRIILGVMYALLLFASYAILLSAGVFR